MPFRARTGTVLAVVAVIAAVAVHLLLGTAAVVVAGRWLGPLAVGLVVAFLIASHAAGYRRLAARRQRDDKHDHEDHDHEDDHDEGHDHGLPDDHGHAGSHEHESGGRLLGVIRAFGRPHAHSPADRIDSALAASASGLRAVRFSLAALGVTAAIQFAVVLASGSVALFADTIHNAADALTAIPLALAFAAARRRPSRRYNYGYGRSEDIAGLFVLLAMTASSLLAAYQAIDRLITPRGVSDLGWVAAAGLVGLVGNELVAVYRIRVGRKIGSAALVADGLHARTDGLTSLAVVIGAAGVAVGWRAADPIAGLVISFAIFAVLWQAAREVFGRIMDRVDDRTYLAAETAVRRIPLVVSLDRLRMRWVGHDLLAELEIASDATLSLIQAHDIAEEVRHQLLHDVPRLADATVHVSPVPGPEADPHGATRHHFLLT